MPNAAAPATEGPDRSVPLHVAIIMDGNGRWAAARGLPRAEGHRRGVEALRRVVRAAHELGVLYLTIFSFSSENWSRPASEIGDLFGLLRRFIRNDLATLHRDGVRVRVIGERAGLESDICALLGLLAGALAAALAGAPAGVAAGAATGSWAGFASVVAGADSGFDSGLASAAGAPTARTALWQPGARLDMFFCRHSSDAAPPGGMLEQCAI